MLAIFLDQETTGLDPTKHAVIEVAFKVVDLTEGVAVARYESVVKQPESVWAARDPASIAINGFTFEEIQRGKDQSIVAEEILNLLVSLGIQRRKAVFICQNPAFDRPFFSQLIDIYTHERLNWPYHWLDLASMFFVLHLKKLQERNEKVPLSMNLSKDEIAKYYNLPPEVKPHKAMNGVEHLILCYEAATRAQALMPSSSL